MTSLTHELLRSLLFNFQTKDFLAAFLFPYGGQRIHSIQSFKIFWNSFYVSAYGQLENAGTLDPVFYLYTLDQVYKLIFQML